MAVVRPSQATGQNMHVRPKCAMLSCSCRVSHQPIFQTWRASHTDLSSTTFKLALTCDLMLDCRWRPTCYPWRFVVSHSTDHQWNFVTAVLPRLNYCCLIGSWQVKLWFGLWKQGYVAATLLIGTMFAGLRVRTLIGKLRSILRGVQNFSSHYKLVLGVCGGVAKNCPCECAGKKIGYLKN